MNKRNGKNFESEKGVGYSALVIGIIKQACVDYENALKRLWENPDNYRAKDEIKSIQNFFHSDYYRMMTKCDGDYMIQRIESDFTKKMKEKK